MRYLIILVVLFGLTSCNQNQENQLVHTLPIENDTNDDLAFLKPILADKRIVLLGENTHGIREYNLLKDRIIRYLHQELGFTVLVFESDFYQCHRANERAAQLPASTTLYGCAFGTWHTTGVLPLFEYLSKTQSTQAPLKLAGMDVQPIGSNKKDRPSFLSESITALDPVYAQEIRGLDSTFLAVYAEGSKARRAYFRSDQGKEMLADYEQFIDYLGSQPMQEGPSLSKMLVAQQTARSLVWYIRQQSAPTTKEYVENRDQGMAENLRFIADVMYPDEKIIVWGHNFHIRHDNISIPPDSVMFPNVAAHTMGYWARSWYQSELYTVGFYAYEGTSMDNGGNIFTISQPSSGSLESLLYDPGAEAVFADLSQASGNGTTAWVNAPITGRYNGETPLSLIPKDQYDGIVLINSVTPREMLY